MASWAARKRSSVRVLRDPPERSRLRRSPFTEVLSKLGQRCPPVSRPAAPPLPAVADRTARHHRGIRTPSASPALRRSASDAAPVGKGGEGTAGTRPDQPHTKQEVTQAGAFPAWLASQSRAIGQCQQADIDAWHTESLATRRPPRSFLQWCMKTGRMPHLTLPPAETTACPCVPGSPPHSFSSMRNQSAASFATPSTTSPTTRPPSPSSWETRRPRCRRPSPT